MADLRAPSSLSAYGRRSGPVTPEYPTRFSYDTAERGEASIGALLSAPISPERPLAFSDDELLPRYNPRSRGAANVSSALQAGRPKRNRSRRSHKPQASGAFLLQDAVVGDDDSSNQRRGPRNTSQKKGKDLLEPYSSSVPRDFGLGIGSSGGNRARVVSPDTSQEELLVDKRHDGHRRGRRPPTSQQGAALDVDSTQIVNMALNLSESRRIASRRNHSRANPPRLAPVQDNQAGSNLRAHLQQQRKTSRGVSPMPNQSLPNQALTPRLTGVRSSSPLRSPFETTTDAPYRYHFSTSTLARAQKAREHLELMAQYRHLLAVLPPLKMGYDRPAGASPPGSPTERKINSFGSREFMIPLGREYNPLQYIRNRKVRARERMAIDGEKQGFADVESVKDWVNEAADRAARDLLSSDTSALPPFPGAEDIDPQVASDSVAQAALRVRRPRVDWLIEPCDLIADAYWLEQDHHKQLIEDRFLGKIYPQTTDTSRPMSRQTDELGTDASPFVTKTLEDADASSDKPLKIDTDTSEASHRGRAKQKLHDMGSFHRHTTSTHNHHDFLRKRRGSLSDSGSEDEVKSEGRTRRPRRAGTISSRDNELLEKQMLEMIARETRQQRLSHVQETEAEHMQADGSAFPEHVLPLKSPGLKKWSETEPSDSDPRLVQDKGVVESSSRLHLGRYTGGGSKRGKHQVEDIDSPQPMSPELNPRQSLSAPPTGLELSAPSSRSSSPSRNPFTKVKQIFRDKSREEDDDQPADTESSSRRPSIPEPASPTESKPLERHPSDSRQTSEGHRYQRSAGSVRPRGDDQVGLRGIFKGPRIDTVIRGGVSRLGDMLWKRETPLDPSTEVVSADESDNDQSKGRTRLSLNLSRSNSRRNKAEAQQTPKHFLDTMPQFQPVADTRAQPGLPDNHKSSSTDVKKLNEAKPRGLVLRPPKLDPPDDTNARKAEEVPPAEPEMSETESCRESARDGPRTTEKNDEVGPMVRFDEPDNFKARKWSIANQALPQEGHLSKREVARLRTLILTSGIKAMEISRRAQEPRRPLGKDSFKTLDCSPHSNVSSVPWVEIAKLTPTKSLLSNDPIPCCDHFPLASRTLGVAIQTSMEQWQTSADRFTGQTRPKLEERIWCVRSRIADELSGMTGEGADQADETGKDLALGQLLKVKHVLDLIETMMRNRRRRFRWLRRGMWSVVEWVLVGFMWYVWFVVTIFRIVLGLGQGVWGGIKWLLWL